MTDDDLRRYSEAEVLEISIGEFRRKPQVAFETVRSGYRVIVRAEDGSVLMRMSPEFDD